MSMKGFYLRSVDRDNDSHIANHIPGNGTARTLHAVEGTFSPLPLSDTIAFEEQKCNDRQVADRGSSSFSSGMSYIWDSLGLKTTFSILIGQKKRRTCD